MNLDIIIATGNSGKVREIREILSGLPVVLHPLTEYFDPLPVIVEDGETFYDNARLKSQWVFSRTGIASLADDSGLEVDFLNGQPGVHSARFAGEPTSDKRNIEKLLTDMSACRENFRIARFRCAIVLTLSDTEEISAEGVCEGAIGYEKKGVNGFGYDPLFTPLGYGQTFAELDASIKNSISHRGKALLQLHEKLHERYR